MSNTEAKYRHELKYLISSAEMELLRRRMRALMAPDPHVGEGGVYNISSVYFDSFDNRCLNESENGTDPREKFRVRIYNHSASRIMLECKRKERGMTQKQSCLLTETQARRLTGQGMPVWETQSPLVRKLALRMAVERMRPVVIVDYDRYPFVCPNGNVRITLDTNISSSADVAGFFDRQAPRRPVLPAGHHLLEVKYDEFLPDEIYRALQLDNLRQTAFSKYYLCRKFTLRGI